MGSVYRVIITLVESGHRPREVWESRLPVFFFLSDNLSSCYLLVKWENWEFTLPNGYFSTMLKPCRRCRGYILKIAVALYDVIRGQSVPAPQNNISSSRL